MTELLEREMLVVKEGEQYVLVKKTEIKELIDKLNDQPVWATGLKWLENKTGLSRSSLPEKVLYPHREELESFVDYPDRNGERWRFNIKSMDEWLVKNFKKVEK